MAGIEGVDHHEAPAQGVPALKYICNYKSLSDQDSRIGAVVTLINRLEYPDDATDQLSP